MLDAHDDAGDFLDSAVLTQSPAWISRGQMAEGIGTQIGGYKLLQEIGEVPTAVEVGVSAGVVVVAEKVRRLPDRWRRRRS